MVSQNVMTSLKVGFIGGFMGFSASFVMNYFVLPMPETLIDIAMGNGISGLISGFMGGFMGLLMYLKQADKVSCDAQA